MTKLIAITLGIIVVLGLSTTALAANVAPAVGVDAWGDQGARFDLVVGRNVEQFKSYADYLAQPVGSTYPVVMYDPERWDSTPPNEQDHPKGYMKLFVALAHERGQLVILAPSRGLASDCRRPDETINAAFIRCRYAAIPTDYFQLQSQKLECRPMVYQNFVLAARLRSTGSSSPSSRSSGKTRA